MKPSKLSPWCLEAPKDFELAMTSRRASLSDNTSLIATYSWEIFGTYFCFFETLCSNVGTLAQLPTFEENSTMSSCRFCISFVAMHLVSIV